MLRDRTFLSEPKSQEEYEKLLFDFSTLLDISKTLNSTLNFADLTDTILFTCMTQMRVDQAVLFTKNHYHSENLVLNRNFQGLVIDHTIDQSDEYTIPESHPLILELLNRKECMLAEEVDQYIASDQKPSDLFLKMIPELEATLLIPLISENLIMGLIILGPRIEGSEILEDEKRYILEVAFFASQALRNSQLYELASSDMMTGLKIRHYFDNALKVIAKKARNTGEYFSMVMLDIDHFKKVNDTYGHSCGDLIIKSVAAVLKQGIRERDMAARFGGEEFVLLLPGLSEGSALKVADRIRKQIEKIVHDHEGTPVTITISAGIAEFSPGRDHSAVEFLDRADKALYFSKDNGRNRVTMASTLPQE